MGYYSQLNYTEFKTDLSKEEFERVLTEFKDSLSENSLANFWYSLDVIDGEVVITDDDLYAKHYGDRELATFFSKVIAPGERTCLTFEGEDGERWGYAIEKGKVVDIDYPEPLVNGVPLNSYLQGGSAPRKYIVINQETGDPINSIEYGIVTAERPAEALKRAFPHLEEEIDTHPQDDEEMIQHRFLAAAGDVLHIIRV